MRLARSIVDHRFSLSRSFGYTAYTMVVERIAVVELGESFIDLKRNGKQSYLDTSGTSMQSFLYTALHFS